MVRIALLSICALCIAIPVVARDHFTVDGKYTICSLPEFKNCEELTDYIVQSDRFSSEERRLIMILKSFTDAPDSAILPKFVTVFGNPSVEGSIPLPTKKAYGASWLTAPKDKCSFCTIQAIFSDGSLESVNYGVIDKFIISWYRAAR